MKLKANEKWYSFFSDFYLLGIVALVLSGCLFDDPPPERILNSNQLVFSADSTTPGSTLNDSNNTNTIEVETDSSSSDSAAETPNQDLESSPIIDTVFIIITDSNIDTSSNSILNNSNTITKSEAETNSSVNDSAKESWVQDLVKPLILDKFLEIITDSSLYSTPKKCEPLTIGTSEPGFSPAELKEMAYKIFAALEGDLNDFKMGEKDILALINYVMAMFCHEAQPLPPQNRECDKQKKSKKADCKKKYPPKPCDTRSCEKGLIAHWDFDDGSGNVLTDKSCNKQHGQIMGEPTWVDGVQGGGLLFDGDDDYIDMGNDPVLDITGDLTISIWLKPDYTGETDYFEVISKRNAANHTGVYGINIHPTAAWIQFFYSISPRKWTYPPYKTIPLGGEWTHFVGTRSVDVNTHSAVLKYYYNGILVYTDYESRRLPKSHIEEPLIVGMLPNSDFFYKGIMDNIRIYDRVLDDAEIQALFQE